MEKAFRKISFLLALAAIIIAIILFAKTENIGGGLALTIFWLLLAIGMMQTIQFKKFAYTVVILSAVTVALTFPQYFSKIGDFQLKALIVPLLQIITFGVGCTMSWHDLSGV